MDWKGQYLVSVVISGLDTPRYWDGFVVAFCWYISHYM